MRLAPILLFAACTASEPEPVLGPRPVFLPDSPDLMDIPWPSDLRTREDGTMDLHGFPNPYALPLLDGFITLADSVRGFGANAPVFVRFDAPIDVALLPDAEGSRQAGSPIQLLDVDPDSPWRGERVPLQFRYSERRTLYEPAPLLAAAPVFGFPLRRNTTYALVITEDLAGPAEGFASVWEDGDPSADVFLPLRETWEAEDRDLAEISVAAVFTVGDPLEEMDTIARFLRERVASPDLTQDVMRVSGNLFYEVYRGQYVSPNFAHGERPFTDKGGGFAFREDGLPLIANWDDMRLAICLPVDRSAPPPEGWPVVIQQHGTGGSYTSHCGGSDGLEAASQASAAGYISLGIDQPLHGNRGGENSSDLDHFNFLNPVSGRTNFRQGAIDAIYLARALHEHPPTFTLPSGETVRLDPERVAFFGHSQGALTGALALPWMSPDVDTTILSAAGGVLSVTLVERKDPVDIAALIEGFVRMEPDDALTPLHPVAALVQHLVDVTDPVNYAPYWFAEEGGWEQRPANVLLTSGTLDQQTPTRTAEILAAAARLPILAPEIGHPDVFRLRGMGPLVPPLSGDAEGYDGSRVTSGFSQWEGGSHWTLFENVHAAGVYRTFLQSSAEGDPRIDYANP